MNESQLALFFKMVRQQVGALTTTNVVGFKRVLAEGERRKTPLADLAYILATGWWESGKTMAPVEEGYYLGPKAAAFRRKLRYYPYYGRGLVQLTWLENYRKASKICGVDLVNNPEAALDPDISCKILFDGMERGWFTGKKLDDYIDDLDESDDEDLREYANARRIVNGTDRQVEIGQLALGFEKALRKAGYGTSVYEPAPKPKPADAVAGGGAVVAAGGAVVAAQQGNWWIAAVMALAMVAAVAFIVIRKWRK